MKQSYRIGTRSTAMALAQTKDVAARWRSAAGGYAVEIVKFSPQGDRDQISRLQSHGGKGGAFVREIREAIRDGALEAAMHSLKDMPGDEETPGLVIGAMMSRESAFDALALREDHKLAEFEAAQGRGYKIGTNSVRRAAYCKRLYPQAEIIHFRGAADSRIRKLDQQELQKLPGGGAVGPADALIVAECGMRRVGLGDRVTKVFSPEEMLPAVGQGVVAVECGERDWETRAQLALFDDPQARLCASAEREMLWVLNGHCNAPIAGHAMVVGEALELCGAVISLDGKTLIAARRQGDKDRPRELGRAVGLSLLEKGAAQLIEQSRLAGE